MKYILVAISALPSFYYDFHTKVSTQRYLVENVKTHQYKVSDFVIDTTSRLKDTTYIFQPDYVQMKDTL